MRNCRIVKQLVRFTLCLTTAESWGQSHEDLMVNDHKKEETQHMSDPSTLIFPALLEQHADIGDDAHHVCKDVEL